MHISAWSRHLTRLSGGAVLLAMGLVAGCENGTTPAQGGKKPKVIVTEPITGKVVDYQDFTGRLKAVKMVEMRARVSGYITDVPFKEGDLVNEGDTLFQIDVRPYKADLNQAEANLKVAIAERALAHKNADRASKMILNGSISREDYDTALAAVDKSIASVGASEAARDKAKLYLDYTRVIAPFSGRISRRFVDPGNLVIADNTMLTTIVTEDPVWAYFDVDERSYLDLLGRIAPGKTTWVEGMKLPVLMRLANETEYERDGVVDFVDNSVTPTTGTVTMRGVFDNLNGLLKAGLFLRIRLPIGQPYQTILIPDEAIQSDQERKYVWVVKKEVVEKDGKKEEKDVIDYRSVTIGAPIKELRVIRPPAKGKEGKEGLAEGDRVVISGMQRVRKGTAVEVEAQSPPTRPEMPLVRLLEKKSNGGT